MNLKKRSVLREGKEVAGRERNGRNNIEKEKARENNSKMLKMRKEEEEWRKDGERDMRIDE